MYKRQIIQIEEAFGLDGLTLLSTMASDKPHPNPKYTQIKALYALAWICLSRSGKILSIDDVLDEYSIDEFSLEDDDPKELPTAEVLSTAEPEAE